MSKMLTELRNGEEHPLLSDSSRVPLQQALLDLYRAFQNLFASRKKAAAGEGGQKVIITKWFCRL